MLLKLLFALCLFQAALFAEEMKLTYTLFYVKDLHRTIDFYEKNFGIRCKFIHESGLYAEFETGPTTLAFSQYELFASLFKEDPYFYQPGGLQITFEPEDVDKAYQYAISQGVESVLAPTTMPWQWRVALLKDPDGFLIELAKPL